MFQVDERYNGKSVELMVGQTIEVLLPENRTTGFHWHVESDGAAATVPIDDSFLPPSGPVGSGGSHRWVFQAVQPGEGIIELVYRRAWEQRTGRTFTLHILVKP